ncbi:hypothetical protein DQ353_02855 [Arthrobacter sp. AQ5-05]|uniref:hypothetical protein n=1 Tax=Arthrobacter sp. AQ5-05 TaxID=2184581 RepID=UPI000DCAE5CC|nr:hypothetical protein [Arthrobacter sp. AQ5-05]RAX50514.1 hypothetical protein DQ353_02855 [Arthrobacter sp. AQ5-05]
MSDADSATADSSFSAQERAAMKSRARELKTEAKRASAAQQPAADAADVSAKIAAMPEGDRQMAECLHSIVAEVAPGLAPKLYYGQPGHARDGASRLCLMQEPVLSKDVGAGDPHVGTSRVTLTHHAASPGEAERILSAAVAGGGTQTGHQDPGSATITDPDGHRWLISAPRP